MVVDLKAAEFTSWTALIDPFVFDINQPYFNVMVPTADTTRWRIYVVHTVYINKCHAVGDGVL